jgi:hypothetical protein
MQGSVMEAGAACTTLVFGTWPPARVAPAATAMAMSELAIVVRIILLLLPELGELSDRGLHHLL